MADPADRFLDLERALQELSPHITYPPTPDIAAVVRQAIAHRPARQRSPLFWPGWLQPRRLAFAAAALVILLGVAMAVSPGLRSSIAKRLGVRGIEIILVDETPTPRATPVGATLILGEPVTLAEAQARVGYVIHIPAELGPPDEVYLRQVSAGPMVTLLYRARDGLPAASETGVGALLMQFPAVSETTDLVKMVTGGMGDIHGVQINGNAGFWVTGETTLVINQDPSATFTGSTRRPSADVLIWEQDDLSFRLEASIPLDDARRIAESLEP
jgi:hypothetical protein